MAIRVIEGVPGSGKTYYAVNHCIESYFYWDDRVDCYVPKKENTRVITNIAGAKFGDDLDECIKKAGGLEKFFSVDTQRQAAKSQKLVYIIDEAQRYFPRKFHNAAVFYFFQYHRHLGIDIYLITQDVKSLAQELRSISEYYIRAVRRSYSLGPEFRYRFLGSESDDQAFKTKVLRRNPRIFALYSSMTRAESESIGSVPRQLMLYVGIFAVLTLGAGYFFITVFFPRHAVARDSSPALPPRSPAVVVAAAPAAVSVPPAVAPTPIDPWEVQDRVIVEGLIGSSVVDTKVFVRGVEHGRSYSATYALPDLLRLCRCVHVSIRVGGELTLWRYRNALSPPPVAKRWKELEARIAPPPSNISPPSSGVAANLEVATPPVVGHGPSRASFNRP